MDTTEQSKGILDFLKDNPGSNATVIAKHLGLAEGVCRERLDKLHGQYMIERNRKSRNYEYVLADPKDKQS